MLKIILGVSITLNAISSLIFFLIYKYSFKGFKKNLEKQILNNFIDDSIDLDMIGSDLK